MLTRYKADTDRLLKPVALLLVRTGVPASAITVGCPLLMAGACWLFFQSRAVLPFCAAALLIGLLDGLDGAVARQANSASASGAYLDALCDRYVDAMVVITAAAVTGYWFLSALVLCGSLLISYAKARAAMEVPVSNQEWPDLMERSERSILFLGGLAAASLVSWRPMGRDLFWWTLLLLAVLIHLTVIQRMIRAFGFIQARGRGG